MSKDLKTFIGDNREAFDNATPPGDLWGRITAELDQRGQPADGNSKWRFRFGYVMKVAAITLVVGTAGILIFFYGKKSGYDDYSRINPTLAAQQQTYAQLVVRKKDSLAFISASDPVLKAEFSDVLHQMELNYEALKHELARSPNKSLTLEAMVSNLQTQMEVLSQQLEVLQYINNREKEPEHEQI